MCQVQCQALRIPETPSGYALYTQRPECKDKRLIKSCTNDNMILKRAKWFEEKLQGTVQEETAEVQRGL